MRLRRERRDRGVYSGHMPSSTNKANFGSATSTCVCVIGRTGRNVQNALPSVVAEMIPLRMTKSPKCSPSRRSCAYDLIIGRRMLIISCSSTDSR